MVPIVMFYNAIVGGGPVGAGNCAFSDGASSSIEHRPSMYKNVVRFSYFDAVRYQLLRSKQFQWSARNKLKQNRSEDVACRNMNRSPC